MGILKIKFKYILEKFLFCLYLIFVLVQIYVVLSIDDKRIKNATFLFYFKNLYFVFIFISSICHIQSSITNPGKIVHDNNVEYIDFYVTTRSIGVKRAEIFNRSSRHLIRAPVEDEDNDEEEYSDTENDDNIYMPSPFFTDEKIQGLNKELEYEFSRCTKCNVCRMPNVHHCSLCQGCIYSMDHHCPWLNNCIGQFNQKYFIQYCIYSLVSSALCAFILIYYVAIKQPLLYFDIKLD
jgi:hypothetical protein